MGARRWRLLVVLAPGLFALVTAVLSVADLLLPQPFDGVVLEADAPGTRMVRQVVPGSGAERAGIAPGDLIVGIDRTIIRSTTRAHELLQQHSVGERVPYLVSSGGRRFEVAVELGRRHLGDAPYFFACLLGLVFFGVGAFVVVRQPRQPAVRTFYTMCWLFMLFLVCRLRPASYSWVDTLVLNTGTVALLFLPGAFLHFFLIFPRPIWEWRRDPVADALGLVARFSRQLVPIYLLPPLVYVGNMVRSRLLGTPLTLISGAPAANWWVMAAYMVLGLGALGLSGAYLPDPRQRRGAFLVFLGTVFGVVPFIVLAVAFPSFLHTERFLYSGVLPLALVPLTFAYAIVRFQLLDIRVILRKSLLYTLTTAVVTALYALGIASFNHLVRGTELEASPFFPVLFALAIVLLFEPLRHRIQGPVDRFFFAERLRLQRAMVEMGEAFTVQVDPGLVVRQLVGRLPELLGLHFAALYLFADDRLRRAAGPDSLPEELTRVGLLRDHLQRYGALVRIDDLAPLRLLSPATEAVAAQLEQAGVEVAGLLASPRRPIGVVLLSAKTGQMPLEREELDLLRGLLHQAAIALETSFLLDERARQAELERELQIAAAIQASLLPKSIAAADGWAIAAVCRPARAVGGDFYAELPGAEPGARALVYGDVSGKSISGALMMMAAHEVLNALALAHPEPEQLLDLANERLHSLRGRAATLSGGSFLALGYLGPIPGSGRLRYTLAGQPPPLVRRASGDVVTLPMPLHRVPLGAFRRGGYTVLETTLGTGDLLLAYSDGVVEAQSPEGEFFGETRLVEALLACPPGDPQRSVEVILTALDEFSRGQTPYDDLTLVAVARNGAEGGQAGS